MTFCTFYCKTIARRSKIKRGKRQNGFCRNIENSLFSLFCRFFAPALDFFLQTCYTAIEREFTVNNCQTIIQLGINLR